MLIKHWKRQKLMIYKLNDHYFLHHQSRWNYKISISPRPPISPPPSIIVPERVIPEEPRPPSVVSVITPVPPIAELPPIPIEEERIVRERRITRERRRRRRRKRRRFQRDPVIEISEDELKIDIDNTQQVRDFTIERPHFVKLFLCFILNSVQNLK